jgi:GDP-4-dehydro-6-deoxy-D-mannose reductase
VARLLVTGRHGFVGRTLAGMVASEPSLSGWDLAPVPGDFQILDAAATDRLVHEAEPDAVLHLAAQSSAADSLRDPETTLQVNVIGTLRLLEALRRANFRGRMVFVSSGDIYGVVPTQSLPIAETLLPAPRNPYGVSKLAAEALCCQWALTEGMHVTIARPFNHIGPGQTERFAIPAFARQLDEIRRRARPPVVEVGDIDVTRDFTDVRDVVRAYFALIESGVSGERYNVCSGEERTVRSLLDTLIELAGIDVEIRQDAARLRPSEQRRAVGDPSKIRAATDWRAKTSIRDSLAAVLDEHRTRE